LNYSSYILHSDQSASKFGEATCENATFIKVFRFINVSVATKDCTTVFANRIGANDVYDDNYVRYNDY